MNRNSYPFYSPLDRQRGEIRLVILYPKTKWPELTCALVTTTLEAATNGYQCLSYCWGNMQEKATIRLKHNIKGLKEEMQDCQKDSSGYKVRITLNLKHALSCLRDEELFTLAWADSICINQADQDERSHQVSLMRSIYSNAYRVVIWLGDEDESTNPAFDGINQIAGRFERVTQRSAVEFFGPDGITFPVEHLRDIFDQGTDMGHSQKELILGVYHSLAHLFERPWFSRVWVLQEVHSTSDAVVYCGKRFAPWGFLLLAHYWHKEIGIQFLDETPYYDGSTNSQNKPWRSLSPIWEHISICGKNRRLPITQLVRHVREFLATDQRDYVYALLGIAEESADPENLPALMIPDYTKPTYQVYAEYTIAMIESQRSLDILSLVDYRSPYRLSLRESGLPTWSVSFNGGPPPESSLGVWEDSDAAASRPLEFQADLSRLAVYLAGLRVDKVAAVIDGPCSISAESQGATPIEFLETALHTTFRFLAAVIHRTDAYPTGEDKLIAGIRTITANHYPKHRYFKDWAPKTPENEETGSEPSLPSWHSILSPTMLADFAAFWNTLDEGMTILEPRHREKFHSLIERGNPDELRLRVASLVIDRCYFMTAGGYIGLGPSGLRQGDHIVILHGGKVPFVLRTAKDANARSSRSDSIVFDFLRQDESCYTIAPDPFEVDDIRDQSEHPGYRTPKPWFEFIGECYIHGYMEGEAFQPEHAGQFATFFFELR